ncbi:MAG: hypothetical protein RI945_247 [Candidatus Parcubacteria bacterium]|jgi:thiosulfate dehydrogenase [quinone] large subunit
MKTFCKKIYNFFVEDKRSAIFWLLPRFYVGYIWFMAGFEKVGSPAWIGPGAGNALSGFLNGALTKTAGAHPDVMLWYAWLIKNIFLPLAPYLSYFVVFGEMLVGIALIIGFKTRKAAFAGAFMNINYLFSGTVSINPLLLILQIFIMLSKRVSGYFGLDGIIKRGK